MGRFEVLERIGSGGMGTVYRAYDERLEREVALKQLQSADSERVLREAQAAARLNHPAIVTLYELGEHAGRAVLVSELVPGETLEALRAAGMLYDRDVAEVTADLCEALSHAHARGVVHRDIKPQNVIVCDDPRAGRRAKLMDFGIAQDRRRADPDRGRRGGRDARLHVARAGRRRARRAADRRLLARPDRVRMLGRRQPGRRPHPGADGAADRPPGGTASSPAPGPARGADGDDRRVPRGGAARAPDAARAARMPGGRTARTRHDARAGAHRIRRRSGSRAAPRLRARPPGCARHGLDRAAAGGARDRQRRRGARRRRSLGGLPRAARLARLGLDDRRLDDHRLRPRGRARGSGGRGSHDRGTAADAPSRCSAPASSPRGRSPSAGSSARATCRWRCSAR